MPNKSIVEGVVKGLIPAADGHGADLELLVERSEAAEGYADFIRTTPGATLRLFAAEPDVLCIGGHYRLTASVLGGPTGERSIVETAQPMG